MPNASNIIDQYSIAISQNVHKSNDAIDMIIILSHTGHIHFQGSHKADLRFGVDRVPRLPTGQLRVATGARRPLSAFSLIPLISLDVELDFGPIRGVMIFEPFSPEFKGLASCAWSHL